MYKRRGFADLLGLTKQSVAKWESSKSEPGLDTLKKLADFFEVSVDHILSRTDYRTTPHIQAAHIDEEGPPVTENALSQIKEIIKREREKIRRDKTAQA